MAKTPAGTSVGVADPYEFVERCDHLTDDGRCRYALEHGQRASRRDAKQSSGRGPRDRDLAFTRERRQDDFGCPVVTDAGPAWEWKDCPHFRARNRSRECVRCGLCEHRVAHTAERPLLEEHHLSYFEDSTGGTTHEITVFLCRWCHAKVHTSWARLTDDANPDPEALAAREGRRSREHEEFEFSSAAERREDTNDT